MIHVWQIEFDAPMGNDPVALNLSTMGKGEAWVNGHSIGRYWVSFLTPKGHPSQILYVKKSPMDLFFVSYKLEIYVNSVSSCP